CQKYDSSPFIF
nr:immunoglobulin light chain junction region [Macaca mulatta]MOX48494.1 immunoglobulin light chain junction region [Macaca mulatta]MOX48675.1 immunoglobulin light chain junction region [Macaca mulatta]MOX49010.1 immunoglobulin light chain junction region [Macaca mulatta]MOX49237.1 immunoglobulin light chain junction region [Macaca mulatta]